MTKQTALVQIGTTLKDTKFRQNLIEALPEGVSVDRFTRVTLTALSQNPDLLNKDRQSLYLAVTKCAQDGLMPDGRQAALVAFGSAISYMPMVSGLRRIAAKYGVAIASAVVHENDEFDYALGVEPVITHKPAKLGTDRGKPIGAWAEGKDADGNRYLEVMDVGQIEDVRKVSRAAKSGPWVSQWGEMARKTVVRRLFKSLPLYDMDDRDSSALAASDAEFDYGAPTATSEQQTPRAGRPSALQAVVDADEEIIEGEATEVEASPAPVTAADDVF